MRLRCFLLGEVGTSNMTRELAGAFTAYRARTRGRQRKAPRSWARLSGTTELPKKLTLRQRRVSRHLQGGEWMPGILRT